ncbi:MAG: hypothetical protein B1H09_07500 [Gemmatimonadaceae bacterium 4484_173]|nr:MAG: hypothetical protein B1H09_07500 [Gemmatimonadaceae bacterium 4484_173]
MNTISVTLLLLTAAVFFQDDFNDGNADGWYTVGPSNYQVQNGWYNFSGGGAVNDATSYRGDAGEQMSTADYSMLTDVIVDVGIFGGMMVRYSEDGLYNMMLVLSVPHQALRLYRWHWSSIELLDSYSFSVQTGTAYTARFQCSGNSFTGKAWLQGEAEPENWFVSATDTLTRSGSAALFCAGTSKQFTDVYMSCFFDNVTVETPEPWALSQTTWAGIKNNGSH